MPLFLLVILSIFLVGCEQKPQKQSAFPEVVKKYAKLTTLKGTVSYKGHDVSAGTIKVTSTNGKLITSTTLELSNQYQVEIPAGTELPILLTFHPEVGSKNNESLVSAVVHPNVTQYDINPFTTAIAKKAQSLGGYTHTNMIIAAENAVHVPDENKTSSGWRGDPTKQYGGWH